MEDKKKSDQRGERKGRGERKVERRKGDVQPPTKRVTKQCAECKLGYVDDEVFAYGYCASCWSVVQYRPEHGTPCSSCATKLHPSLLKEGLCSGCAIRGTVKATLVPVWAEQEATERIDQKLENETNVVGVVFVVGSNGYGQVRTESRDCFSGD